MNLDALYALAGEYAVDLYKDYSKNEIKVFGVLIQMIWKLGKRIQDFNEFYEEENND
jgi:hypothetical protein